MSRLNRKVSQVWLVVLLSFVMVITIMWHAHVAVGEIEADLLHTMSISVGAKEQ